MPPARAKQFLSAATDLTRSTSPALSDFTAKFADGLPSTASVAASLTGSFRHDDEDGATFAAELSGDSSLVGASFTDVNIRNIDYSDLTQVTANVDFTVMRDRNS